MKDEINKKSMGMFLGKFVALLHIVWLLLVLLGIAKPLMNWILDLHQISFAYTIMPFNIFNAILLVLVTFGIGYVLGYVLAWFWNKHFCCKK